MTNEFTLSSDVWPGLAKLVEESGELNQIIAKLMATGGHTTYFDGSDLLERFEEELADLKAVIKFVEGANGLALDLKKIKKRARSKLQKFQSYWIESGMGPKIKYELLCVICNPAYCAEFSDLELAYGVATAHNLHYDGHECRVEEIL